MTAPDELHAQVDAKLRASGASDDEIARAREAGTLALLAVAHAALPSQPKYTAAELADRVGMDHELSARFWRALGFADVGDDERVFTDEDAEALSTANALIETGVASVEVAVQMSRVLGSSLARVAEAMLDSARRGERDPVAAELFALTAASNLATQSKLIDYVWRRHLQATSRRHLVAEADGPTTARAVGFADLVGFTALSQQVDEDELADVVARFEALAFDQVAVHGGRVAKMIGDEVMFVVEEVGAALDTALDLAEAYADDDVLSDVRVGLAWGDVLAREGDYYGPVVNLASRVVNIAFPGSVVVNEAIHDALGDDPRYQFHSLRPRNLKDIGRVRLWRVRRGHPAAG